jgi:hypothetical protein
MAPWAPSSLLWQNSATALPNVRHPLSGNSRQTSRGRVEGSGHWTLQRLNSSLHGKGNSQTGQQSGLGVSGTGAKL